MGWVVAAGAVALTLLGWLVWKADRVADLATRVSTRQSDSDRLPRMLPPAFPPPGRRAVADTAVHQPQKVRARAGEHFASRRNTKSVVPAMRQAIPDLAAVRADAARQAAGRPLIELRNANVRPRRPESGANCLDGQLSCGQARDNAVMVVGAVVETDITGSPLPRRDRGELYVAKPNEDRPVVYVK